MSGGSDNTFSGGSERQQLTTLNQLLWAMGAMSHMDEVLRWLVFALVQRFDIPLLEFWTSQANAGGQREIQLCALAAQDPSVPERVVVNEQVMQAVERIAQERAVAAAAVERLFPAYHASLLKRCGFNYCAGCSIDTTLLLANLRNSTSADRSPLYLAITMLFFLRQSPQYEVVRAAKGIVEQALVMADSRGLLASPVSPLPLSRLDTPQPPEPAAPPPPSPPQPEAPPRFSGLIPRRKQDPDLLKANNPFAGQVVISDKQARRLYAAIDGRITIGELGQNVGMNPKEVQMALQFLLSQRRIELYQPDGRLVKDELFFQER